jgi:hypothetical protein
MFNPCKELSKLLSVAELSRACQNSSEIMVEATSLLMVTSLTRRNPIKSTPTYISELYQVVNNFISTDRPMYG